MAWLLTGGAGYIGSHIAREFTAAGKEVVVLDNLSTGFREFVPDDLPFVDASIGDAEALARLFGEHQITGVVHLAALKYVGQSVADPLLYFRENVEGMRVLLAAVAEHGVPNFVFSSSSSWYGTIDSAQVSEDAPPSPESPYGQTKVAGEWLLRDAAAATSGLAQTSLRYFNVVGSGPDELADHSPHNLFPKVLRAISAGENPKVFGDDYDTPDGSCVRDYVHVVDLARAHLSAAEALESGRALAPAYNVGRGEGVSVFEILEQLRAASGIDFAADVEARRPGDPARIVGAVDLIARDLDYAASFSAEAMAASAWSAWQRQLDLYGGPPPGGARGGY